MGEQDIGGTNLIAKGESGAESEKRRKLLKKQIAEGSQEEIERVSQYYNGGQNAKYYNSQRRQNLRMDDANPRAMEKLNSHQQRSLLKRKRFADKTVKAKISRIETKRLDAAIAAADAEIILNTEQSGFLEVDSEMERTYKLTQNQLKEHLDEQTAKHIYDLKLDQYSPYGMNYDRSGRCGLLYGKNGGHIALMDMHTMALKTEIHLNEKWN